MRKPSRSWEHHDVQMSGFGADTSYEAGLRAMTLAGFDWIDENPDANPEFRGFKNVAGIVLEDNEDARALTAAIMDAEVVHPDVNGGKPMRAGDDATGAMHQWAVRHTLAYKRLGWDGYWREMLGSVDQKHESEGNP